MTIRLKKFYKQAKKPYEMQLIAGEAGLNNIISWVHMIEDEEVAEFLRGNELIFTTGIAHEDPFWIREFVERLIRNKAGGLVVNIGPYIQEVDEKTLKYCRQSGFPLFTIPWHIRLVDVTRDFCRRIINSEQTEISVASAFKNAIFLPEDTTRYQAQLERHGFSMDWDYCAAILAFRPAEKAELEDDIRFARLSVENTINHFSDRYSIFRQDNHLVIVFARFDSTDLSDCIRKIMGYYKKTKRDYQLNIGIGRNESGLPLLAKSYKQAISVLHMAIKRNFDMLYYQDLGIYKILLSAEDDSVLREIYTDVLGKLADYDATYHTDYMNTLKCYLENDASIQAVAKITYVHRNTINYKMGKIREITGYNLTGFEERLKLMLAFKIQEIL